jgi:hypothetical protein
VYWTYSFDGFENRGPQIAWPNFLVVSPAHSGALEFTMQGMEVFGANTVQYLVTFTNTDLEDPSPIHNLQGGGLT